MRLSGPYAESIAACRVIKKLLTGDRHSIYKGSAGLTWCDAAGGETAARADKDFGGGRGPSI